MTQRRWIADEVSGDRAFLTGPQAHHLARVLRARVGQQFEITAGDRVRLGSIVSVDEHRVEFALGDDAPAQPTFELTAVLSVFKFDRLEWAIEKATELGVSRIVPVVAQRTDKHLAQAAAKRAERWRRIAREAAQQARRTKAPEVAEPAALNGEFLDALGEAGSRFVLAESERGLTLMAAMRGLREPITIAVGPEGGWTERELALFAEHGWRAVSLGPTILRAETAAVAGLALVVGQLM